MPGLSEGDTSRRPRPLKRARQFRLGLLVVELREDGLRVRKKRCRRWSPVVSWATLLAAATDGPIFQAATEKAGRDVMAEMGLERIEYE